MPVYLAGRQHMAHLLDGELLALPVAQGAILGHFDGMKFTLSDLICAASMYVLASHLLHRRAIITGVPRSISELMTLWS